MLNEFDQYLHERYLSGKARKDRWYWNNSIQRGRSTAVRENWQWKPAVAYCRYADDFVLIVKGTKAQAEAIREECRGVLEGSLKLRLNMDKTKITHVNDGFYLSGAQDHSQTQVVMARCEWSQRSRRRKPETSPHR
ncbi:reverse transcriptase [Shigella flexneri K-404]|nr:reverse transcriptase [Shigella flexneri K-404]